MSKTDDIHRAILAKASQPTTPRVPGASGARPYVAEAGQRLAEGLREENQRLKAERANGEVTLLLDPKDIGHSKYVNRHTLSLQLADEEFTALYNSIKRDDQDQEILVRPSPSDAPHGKPYEVAFGHRRHGVSMILDQETPGGFKIKAKVKTLSDRELVEVMDRENAQHKGLSAFEQGWQYKTSIEGGLYQSQAELADAKGVTKASITRYLQMANLPAEVLDAFRDPREIKIFWVQDLVRVLTERKAAVLQAAQRIGADGTLTPEQVYKELLREPRSASGTSQPHENTFRVPGSNRVAFRTVMRRGSVRLKWGRDIDPAYQDEFTESLKKFLSQRLSDSPPRVIPKVKPKRRGKP